MIFIQTKLPHSRRHGLSLQVHVKKKTRMKSLSTVSAILM